MILGKNFLQQPAQLGKIPLPLMELEQGAPFGLWRGQFKFPVKGFVGRNYLEITVEHDQRLAHGFDNVLGKLSRFLGSQFQVLAFGDVDESHDNAADDIVGGSVGLDAH